MMTAMEIGNLLLLLGTLSALMFLARAWAISSLAVGMAPALPGHSVRRLCALAVAGATAYVGRHLAPAAVACSAASIVAGTALCLLAS